MSGVFKKILGSFLSHECKHNSMNQFENGYFCPDCGEKVRISWIVIKCRGCRSLRIPEITTFGDASPLKKYCSVCGSEEWYSVKSNSVPINESFHAVPIKEVEREEDAKSSTDVWVEKPEGKIFRPYRNIIKGKKGLKLDV